MTDIQHNKLLPEELEHYITNVVPVTEGWMSENKARELAKCVLSEKPMRCVEIGVFAGRSLVTMALALKSNGFGTIIGIDPWSVEASTKGYAEDDSNFQWWKSLPHDRMLFNTRELIAKTGTHDFIQLLPFTSEQALPYVGSDPIDILHIDGNHSEASALFDVGNYVPLVRQGGIVFFDDCDWITTKPAQVKLKKSVVEVGTVGSCGIFRKI